MQKRPLTAAHVGATLSNVARLPDGRVRAVVVPWIAGNILGGFDMLGVRADDPNDRIPHQHRRSVRASWMLFAWLSVLDPSSINTIDSYVEEGGRHFVRHYFFDFGCAFGSATNYAQGVQQDGEYLVEVGRTLGALFSLGLYRRPFQDQRDEWQRLMAEHPALGYFPAESFDPDSVPDEPEAPVAHAAHRSRRVLGRQAGHRVLGRTDRGAGRDGAVARRRMRATSSAACASGGTSSAAATCAPSPPSRTRPCPRTGPGSASRIWRSPAATRRRRRSATSSRSSDGLGNRIASYEQEATGPAACVPIGGAEQGSGYRVVEIRARFVGAAGHEGVHIGKATRVHLRWRDGLGRFVVVGLERDE